MAIGPIDYMSSLPQVDIGRSIASGLQLGSAIRQQSQEAAQLQAAARAKLQYQQDIAAVSANPSAKAYADLALKYPQQREAYKQAWEQIDESQRKSQGETAMKTAFALESGNTEVAKKVIQDRIAALDNSNQDSTQEKSILSAIDSNPTAVKSELLRWAAFTQDPTKFAENFGKLGDESRKQAMAPAELRQANATAAGTEADAVTKGVTAKYANQNALIDYEKKGWDIKALKSDMEFKRESNRIAAINAAANREGNGLKREELKLKLQEAQMAFDDKVRGKAADVESGVGNIDNMMNTIERIKKNPSLNSVLGSLEGKDFYPNTILGTANPFGDGDQRADAIKLIDTLGSQAFLSQIPNIKGMGALSNAEGAKLEAAFQNLSRAQSEKQFRETLDEATRLLNKGRQSVSKRYGVPVGTPDTPAAPTTGVPAGWSVTER